MPSFGDQGSVALDTLFGHCRRCQPSSQERQMRTFWDGLYAANRIIAQDS
jgi:hypothetical protein